MPVVSMLVNTVTGRSAQTPRTESGPPVHVRGAKPADPLSSSTGQAFHLFHSVRMHFAVPSLTP